VQLGPAPNAATALLDGLEPGEGDLLSALSGQARRVAGVVIPVSDWGLDRVPQHLRPTYRVVDESGGAVGEGKDLAALQASLAPRLQAVIASVAGDLERTGLTAWTIDDVPVEVTSGSIVGYPALVDEGATVALRVLPVPSPEVYHAGARRLLLLNTPSPVRAVSDRLSTTAKLALSANPHGSLTALMADCVSAAADALTTADPRNAAEFEAQLRLIRAGLVDALFAVLRDVEQVLRVAGQLAGLTVTGEAGADLLAQRQALVHPGFVTEVGAARLPDLVRYLEAAVIRAEKQPRNRSRDTLLMTDVRAAEQALAELPPGPGRAAIRWMIEELRVSLFAPTIKVNGPVSVKRIYRAIDDLLP
jgi:ATP-dependent helicase HrpA